MSVASNRISGIGMWGMTVDHTVLMLGNPDGTFSVSIPTGLVANVGEGFHVEVGEGLNVEVGD